MGLPRTVSQVNGDFCRKPQIFPISLYLDNFIHRKQTIEHNSIKLN